MPRAATKKLYRTFVRGLITEANPLTFPENASIDEDNCVLFRKGNRSRRFGVNYEPGHVLSSYSVSKTAFDQGVATTEFKWKSVANRSDINFVVHQVGLSLRFYNLSVEPLSGGVLVAAVDLTPFVVSGATVPERSEVAMASGKGFLFVVGEKIEPLIVEYFPDTQTFALDRIYITMRDFKGVDDGLANDEEPTTLSALKHYNLRNQGWVAPSSSNATDPNTPAVSIPQIFYAFFGNRLPRAAQEVSTPIGMYFSKFGRYPGNNKQWWVAKATSASGSVQVGDFDPQLLSKFYFGNTRAPRGHYVVEAFNIDRSAVSGVAGIPVESTTERPRTVAFFSGRVWYALNSTVYFSQVMQDKRQAGMCYQEADPTAEDVSDLIATDGGVIPIPEMAKALKLVPTGSGVLVFADNGVWFVTGTDSGFTATSISVNKISPIGTDSPNSIVETEGQIYWWSKVGIQGMSQKQGMFGTVEGVFEKPNLSEETVQGFYNKIPIEVRRTVKGVFDPATNVIQWLYRSSPSIAPYKYDRILNLDLTLQAFYPWSVSPHADGPYITGVFTTDTITDIENPDPDSSIRNMFIKYFCAVPVSTNYQWTFAEFNDSTFADWRGFDGIGKPYMSFIETGYELMEDAMRRKQAPAIFCYFRRTEINFVDNGQDYVADRPSSCKFQAKWDWASTQASNKWSTKVEAYRHTRLPMFDESNLVFDTGFPVVVTKNKVRGNGRAIQFRFENGDIGSDFDLLGWAVNYSGNTEP